MAKTYSNTGKLDPNAHFTSFGPDKNDGFKGPVPETKTDEPKSATPKPSK